MTTIFSEPNIKVSKHYLDSGDSILSINDGLEQQLVELCKWTVNLGKYFAARKRLRSKMWNANLANTIDLLLVVGFYPVGHENKIPRDAGSIQRYMEELTSDHILIHPRECKVFLPCSVPLFHLPLHFGSDTVRYVHKSCTPKLVDDKLFITDSLGDTHECTKLFSISLSKSLSVLRHGLVYGKIKSRITSSDLERAVLALCHFTRYFCSSPNEDAKKVSKNRLEECFRILKEIHFLPMIDDREQSRNKELLQNRLDLLTEDNLLVNFRLGRIFSTSSTKVRRSSRIAKKSNFRSVVKNDNVTFVNGSYVIRDNFDEYYPLHQFFSLRISLLERLLKEIGKKRFVQLFNINSSNC